MRFVKKVNERGVLTLPAEVREALGVDEGDIVEFEVLNVIKTEGSKKNKTARFMASVGESQESQDTAEGMQ